jgi:hypothetical protein
VGAYSFFVMVVGSISRLGHVRVEADASSLRFGAAAEATQNGRFRPVWLWRVTRLRMTIRFGQLRPRGAA